MFLAFFFYVKIFIAYFVFDKENKDMGKVKQIEI